MNLVSWQYLNKNLLFYEIILILNYFVQSTLTFDSCGDFHELGSKKTGTLEECDQSGAATSSKSNVIKNLPIITAGYCDTSGSTNECRILAGRFEFKYDVAKQRVIGPCEACAQYVSSGGIHERVPISFKPDGSVLTNDRVINWAKTYVKDGKRLNLLNAQQFNWCKYAPTDNWPYRASFNDQKSNGRYNAYFFNRQSCIYDTIDKTSQHFNTRFLHKSNLRIDLDYNPVLFPLRDPLNDEIRLIKHYRQHWYEVGYEILAKPTASLTYFIKMDDSEREPSLINKTSGPLLSRHAYREFAKFCLSDYYQQRDDKNAKLLQTYCGYDQVEIADWSESSAVMMRVDLHSIPRYPKETTQFFGVDVENDADWQRWAKDGISFSAMTTKPVEGNRNAVDVFLLYSKYLAVPNDVYDEFYPMPYMSKYRATKSGGIWQIGERDKNEKAEKHLNYVDDIAYLHTCKTILVIFGPLYTEMEPDKFNLQEQTKIGAISDLNLFETTNAFFSDPREANTIYFFFRLNYVAKFKYTCGNKGQDLLVTASKVDSYRRYSGNSVYPLSGGQGISWGASNEYSEEQFFKNLNVLQENIPIEAPDPSNYPYDPEPVPDARPTDTSWLYYVIAGVALLILLMLILCFFAMRRIRKRRNRNAHRAGVLKTHRSDMSNLSGGTSSRDTRRSSMASGMPSSNASGVQSRRSSLAPNKSKASNQTSRSQLTTSSAGAGGGGGSRFPTASGTTVRSAATTSSANKPSAMTVRSSAASPSRSGIHPSTRRSSSSSSASPTSSHHSKSKIPSSHSKR